MRYLVTKQQRIPTDSDSFKIATLEEFRDYFKDKFLVGADTETRGFDPHTKEILLCQVGDEENQFAIDNTIDLKELKDFFEDRRRVFIFHNAKFDIRFFFKQDINFAFNQIYDTFLAEKLLYLGYPPGIIKMGLQDCCERYLGVKLDKTVRGAIHREGASDRVIVYGCEDVKYLIPLKREQEKKLKEKDLQRAISVENSFVVVLAYFEFCGVKIDVAKWKVKIENDMRSFNEAKAILDKWVVDLGDPKYIETAVQGDLFNTIDTGPKCKINWASSKQVIPLFQQLGFNLTVKDKVTGLLKQSVDAKVIKNQSDISDISEPYLAYKAMEKVVTTYGSNFIDMINPVTGRIHTNFNQLMDTARLSSGGKDKDSDTKLPNLQNIPRGAETRSCFIPEEGNHWISADYQGQESVIIANVCQDRAMIDFFNIEKGDIHSLVAKMVFPELLEDVPVSRIKEDFPAIRQEAKGYEFLFNYGGDDNTMMATYGLSRQRSKEIYNNYLTGFPGVKSYQEFCRKDVMEKGYILLSPVTGHRAHIYDFDKIKEAERVIRTEGFWDGYSEEKSFHLSQGTRSERMELSSFYFKRKQTSEKQSINYRIQGPGALMFKIACIKFYSYLLNNNLVHIVKMTIPVHDEINVECPAHMSDQISNILVKCMREAGDIFCQTVRLDADVKIGQCWIH